MAEKYTHYVTVWHVPEGSEDYEDVTQVLVTPDGCLRITMNDGKRISHAVYAPGRWSHFLDDGPELEGNP